MYDVVILTDERYVSPTDQNLYIANVLREDKLVSQTLTAQGLAVARKAWSDASFDWSRTRAVLFRSTWDYAERFQAFNQWLMDVSVKTKLLNTYETILWNMDKHYLRDLSNKGIPIVETLFIQPGDTRSLYQLHQETGWDHTVLKPAVSAAAKDTFELQTDTLSTHEKKYAKLIAQESMLLQPFQEAILTKGETSLMVIGGKYTHAVLKVAKPGDFRVQDDFGGTVHDYTSSKAEIALAVDAVKACETLPLYARVDIVTDNTGKPAVSELELIEPEMWFRKNEQAAMILAEKVKEAI